MIKTKLVRITDARLSALAPHELWTTAEGDNPGGSIKDRMVYQALLNASESGILKPLGIVSEISAGSTALSLAYYSKKLGYKCVLFVPSSLAPEKIQALKNLGAEVVLCDVATAYADYELYCKKRPWIWKLDQMRRPEMRSFYEKWVVEDLKPALKKIDLVVGAVGTGHSLMGVSKGFNAQSITAELDRAGVVSGIRNIALERYGPQDPCNHSDFSQRMIIGTSQMFDSNELNCSAGTLEIADSFKVVLGVLSELLNGKTPQRIFAIGANSKLSA